MPVRWPRGLRAVSDDSRSGHPADPCHWVGMYSGRPPKTAENMSVPGSSANLSGARARCCAGSTQRAASVCRTLMSTLRVFLPLSDCV